LDRGTAPAGAEADVFPAKTFELYPGLKRFRPGIPGTLSLGQNNVQARANDALLLAWSAFTVSVYFVRMQYNCEARIGHMNDGQKRS
jgi:hypothetical protein